MNRFVSFDAIDKLLQEGANSGVFTEASVAVRVGDEKRYFSYRVIDEGKSKQEKISSGCASGGRRLFDIASVTKLLVTLLAFRLAKLPGKAFNFGLDDHVQKHVDFSGPYADRLTIRHLLNFHAELNTFMPKESVVDHESLMEMQKQIKSVGLTKEPGSEFRYANWQSILLGEILEQVFKTPLNVLIRSWLLRPLGMTSTCPAFMLNGQTQNCMKSLHGFDLGTVSDPVAAVANQHSKLLGSAGLFSTTEDLLVLVDLILQVGNFTAKGTRMIRPEHADPYEFLNSTDVLSLFTPATPALRFSTGMGIWKNFIDDVVEKISETCHMPTQVLRQIKGGFKRGYGGCMFTVFPEYQVGFVVGTDFLSLKRTPEELKKARILLDRLYARVAEAAICHKLSSA